MKLLNSNVKTVTAFAPATTANVAVGFDTLGFACDVVGDEVTLTVRDDKKLIIDSIEFKNTDQSILPFEIDKNTASVVVKQFCETFDLDIGFTIQIKKGIPLSSGLGGSAASAVAAAIACNAFLKTPLSKEELVRLALMGEMISSGSMHADNVAPCVYGGLTLVHSLEPFHVISLPIPDVCCVWVYPHLSVNTKEARKILNEHISLVDHVKQSAQLASFIAALYEKNNTLLQQSLTDYVIEPQRAQFVPDFYVLKKMALEQGAFGMSFSGSGPTMFAFAETKETANKIGVALCAQLKQKKIEADYWVSKISTEGARIVRVG
jgi:homoserine kinase